MTPSACLVVLALCSALAGKAQGQSWRPTGPVHPPSPVEDRIKDLEFFGAKGFANIGNRLFHTDDFGENWVSSATEPYWGPVRHMAMQGPHLFAAGWNGVFRSVDGGESWTQLPPIPPVTTVEAMFIHRGALLVANATASGSAVYRYSDSAVAWKPLVVKAANAVLTKAQYFAADDSALYIGGSGLFKSQDGGTTWMDLKPGLDEARNLHQPGYASSPVLSLLAERGELFAGVTAGIYRSGDGGSTWSPMLIGYTEPFALLALAGDTLLARSSSGYGLWRFPLDSSSPPSRVEGFLRDVEFLCASDSGVFASILQDIYRSVDGGKTWSKKNPGIRTWDIGTLTSRNGVLHAGGRGTSLFRSLDQGVTWGTGTDLSELQWIKSMTWSGNTLFAVSGQGTNDLYASEDGGTDWIKPGGAVDSLDFEVVAAATGILSTGTLYAAALNTRTRLHELLRSEDKGRSWRPASEPINGGRSGIYSLAFWSSSSGPSPTGQSFIHVGTDSGYFRIDAATGKVDASGLKGKSIFRMFAWEERLFASGEGTNLWRSLDQGLTWEKTAVAVPWVDNVTAFAGYAQTVYAGTFGSGVYRSTDGGSSWEPYNPGPLDPRVSGLVVDGARLYASTSASVYSLELEGPVSFAGGRLPSGKDAKSGMRMESPLGKGRGLPYLEVLQRDGRYRILRLDGRQAAGKATGGP